MVEVSLSASLIFAAATPIPTPTAAAAEPTMTERRLVVPLFVFSSPTASIILIHCRFRLRTAVSLVGYFRTSCAAVDLAAQAARPAALSCVAGAEMISAR
ncbi:hypothetical protein [Nocardia terpenica]|uniref:hypothetical protein n=1 Tax=Nocardia terpenica TaxID=455432 RepID=UPI0002E51424|nr:hypothetical protein [Nocardia terpenica]NQE93656.1 hypothetical protein [Nocardia terpenica]